MSWLGILVVENQLFYILSRTLLNGRRGKSVIKISRYPQTLLLSWCNNPIFLETFQLTTI